MKHTLLISFIAGLALMSGAAVQAKTPVLVLEETPESPIVPVYRFYSASMTDYLYTTDENEKEQLEKDYKANLQTYRYQGIAGYAQTEQSWDNSPVYRFWNEKTTDHFYTADEKEKEAVLKNTKEGKDNYVYEGIAWYASDFDGTQVYRFFNDYTYTHYYTSDYDTMQQLVDDYNAGKKNYKYEGVGWYWFAEEEED